MKKVKYRRGTMVVVPLIGAVLLVLLFLCIKDLNAKNRELHIHESESNLGRRDVEQFTDASHYLTDQARLFVATADLQYLENYFNEVDVLQNREKALEQLGAAVEEETSTAYKYLKSAYESSERLMHYEIYAMKLVCINNGYDMATMPGGIVNCAVVKADLDLSDADRQVLASDMVNKGDYITIQNEINYKINITTDFILSHLEDCVALGNYKVDSCVFKVRTVGIVLCSYVVICVLMYIQMLFRMDKTQTEDDQVNIEEYLVDEEVASKNSNKGYTYLEIGSFILIAAIVCVVISPTIIQHITKSRNCRCINNAINFKEAVDLALIEATLDSDSTVEASDVRASYHAYDSTIDEPEQSNAFAQIVWKASRDFPEDAEFSVIALVKECTVYQVVYRDQTTGQIYIWYNDGPDGVALQNSEYADGYNTWHIFDSAQNEDWVGKYTGITTEVCWNGRD